MPYSGRVSATRKTTTNRVGAVGKVLQILGLLVHPPAGLQLKDISRLSGLNKSGAHRFLKHLEEKEYLFREWSMISEHGTGHVYLIGVDDFPQSQCPPLW